MIDPDNDPQLPASVRKYSADGKPLKLQSDRETVDARIKVIVHMMATGRWLARASAQKLAKEWEVTESAIKGYSRIASRISYAGDMDDLHELKANSIAKLEILAAKAEAKGQLMVAVKAIDTMNEIAGTKVIRSEVTLALPPELSARLTALPMAQREQVLLAAADMAEGVDEPGVGLLPAIEMAIEEAEKAQRWDVLGPLRRASLLAAGPSVVEMPVDPSPPPPPEMPQSPDGETPETPETHPNPDPEGNGP